MVRLPCHIHITGGSGSGTSTLGRAIAQAHGHHHLDTDDFFWEETDPPYEVPRPVGQRVELLTRALDTHETWILSGAIGSWAYDFASRFDLVVWLTVPQEVRLDRLRAREEAEFGQRVAPGGDMHESVEAFYEWAGQYDTADGSMRSFARHKEWTAGLSCPVCHLDGKFPVPDLLSKVESFCRNQH